jgi:hypothetical protein
MGSPAPHTPVVFVKAGTSMMFSAHCVKELAKYGYDPEDFGSHSHVQKRLRAARDRVAADDAAVASGGARPTPPVTDRERFLASCQSGHLSQDAIHREGGSENRGNPCANRVDGYQEGAAPCMPHQGDAGTLGTQHNQVSQLETTQPRDRGLSTNQPYPPDQASADADARCRQTLGQTTGPGQPTGTAPATGAGASAGTSTSGTVGDGGATAPGSVGPVDPNNPGEINGETAADCINAFRKHAMQAMKQNCADSVEDNRNTANGGPGRTAAEGAAHRRNLRRRDEAARGREQAAGAELETANRSRGQHQHHRDQADQALQTAQARTPQDPAEVAAARAHLRDREQSLATAQARCDTASAAHDTASQAAANAQRASTTAANALCLAQQGERLRAGRGRDDPRCPGVNPIPPFV